MFRCVTIQNGLVIVVSRGGGGDGVVVVVVVVSVSVGGGDGLAVCVAGGVRNYHFYPHLLIGREGGREGEMYIS